MIARKEKQFLIFDVDGKIAKYDLSTGKSYGFSGKEVKNISTQLKGTSITELIASFPDENYRRFLKFLNENFVNHLSSPLTDSYGYKRVGTRVQNIGTFLSKIKGYRFFEQFFSAGITNRINRDFCTPIGELPKGFVSWLKNNPTYDLCELTVQKYIHFANEYGEIERFIKEENFECLNKQQLQEMYIPYCYLDGFGNLHFGNPWRETACDKFHCLLNTYKYNKISLLHYIDNLMYFEGIENVDNLLTELKDYNKMLTQISNYKYEKYPKNFLTTHQIVCRNYNRLCQEYPVEDFKERVRTDFETTIDDYIFIYPKTPQDIKDEAVMQNNCVASYIDKVMNGTCHIMFMRKKDNPNKSVVTLEIREGAVVQQKGPFNRDTTEEENQVIQKFNKFIHKKISQSLKNNLKEFSLPHAEKLVKRKKVG